MELGLVSISFRGLTAEQIMKAVKKAGLTCVEWGSDVHAPCNVPEKLTEIVALQQQYGLTCSSYGTYFWLGWDDIAQLPDYIRAAKILGTNILRLWCGKKDPDSILPEEKEKLFADCKAAAAMAERENVILCLECHNNTYTQTKEGALELMQYVNSPAFRMYWQPNQHRSIEENISYIQLLKDYVTHIHVFQWKGNDRFPLLDGFAEWQGYLAQLGTDHTLLLEFMPDDQIETLPYEADALKKIVGGL